MIVYSDIKYQIKNDFFIDKARARAQLCFSGEAERYLYLPGFTLLPSKPSLRRQISTHVPAQARHARSTCLCLGFRCATANSLTRKSTLRHGALPRYQSFNKPHLPNLTSEQLRI